MKKKTNTPTKRRKGAIAVLAAFLMVPLLSLVAVAVDYGYLCVVKTDLQRAADAAALAAVRDLIPDTNGNQDLDQVRSTVRQYAAANVSNSSNFTVLDSDIEIGRFDPATVYTNFTILNTGIFDTVRVTLRRDSSANSPVSLFFARIFGKNTSSVTVTATAVLQKGTLLYAGADILPFSIPEDEWNAQNPGDIWSIYGDGRLLDNFGNTVPGNWGTLDIGAANNSTSDLSDQILNGLRQSDLDALYGDGRIPQNTHIDSRDSWYAQADTGLSSGIKSAVQQVHGMTRLVPLYDSIGGGGGNNAEFHVTGWAVVEVIDSNWQGSKNTYVRIKKSYTYDGDLRPHPDLSGTDGVVQGAYTAPVLVK
ncbi:MAG: hypothetical protein Tsb009_08840 [Planctomycetaceae bacterium]